jgi:hypothetical protein
MECTRRARQCSHIELVCGCGPQIEMSLCSTHAALAWWESVSAKSVLTTCRPWWTRPHAAQSDALEAKTWRTKRAAGSTHRALQPRLLAGALLLPEGEALSALLPSLLATENLSWPLLCEWHSQQDWSIVAVGRQAANPPCLSFHLRILNFAVFAAAAAVQGAALAAGICRVCTSEAVQSGDTCPPNKLVSNLDNAQAIVLDMLASLQLSIAGGLSVRGEDRDGCMVSGTIMAALGLLVRHELVPFTAILQVWGNSLRTVPERAGMETSTACAAMRKKVGELATGVVTTCTGLQAAICGCPGWTATSAADAGVTQEQLQRLAEIESMEALEGGLHGAVQFQRQELEELAAACEHCAVAARRVADGSM